MPNDADHSAPNRTPLDAWFTPGKFAGLLGVFLFFTFFDVFNGRVTFYYRDYGLFTYPIAQHFRDSFWRGELPLWDNLNCCGIPLLAQWNTAMLYPPSLIYLLLPMPWSLGVFNLLHLFLAGMGMYYLARRCTGSQLAAAVAGVAFGFNGLSWHMLMWISNLGAYAWMPWVILAAESAWREGGRKIILAALAGAMQMLTGAPEIIILTWGVVGCLWLMEFFQGEIPRGKMFLRIGIVPVIVAALSQAQLLPFIELLKYSDRDAGFSDSDWAMPLSGPANFLVPPFHCQTTSEGIFVQFSQYWTPSHYAGVAVLAFALAGAWRGRNRVAWLMTAAAGFSILLALGPHGFLYPAIKKIFPQIGFMRYPIKFVTLTMFALPLLAAFGVSRQLETEPTPRSRRLLPGIAVVLLALIAFIVWWAGNHRLPTDDWNATWLNAAVRAVILVVATGAFLWLQRAREFKMQRLLSLTLLLLLWIDIQTHMRNLSPTVDPSVYARGMIRQELKLDAKPAADEPRFMGSFAAINKVRFTNLSKPEANYISRRLSLFDDCNLLDAIPKIDGFVSIFLRESKEVTGRLYAYDQANIELKGLKDFLGIGFVNVPDPSGSSAIEWTNRAGALPLVTAGQQPVFADGDATINALMNTNFEPRAVVYLPPEAKTSVTASRGEVTIVASQVAAQKLIAQVEAKSPAMLVVANAFYKPWNAYVDGKRTTLWRANFAFQALEVPAGRHEVRVIYEDGMFRKGGLISLLTLAGCVVGWFCIGLPYVKVSRLS